MTSTLTTTLTECFRKRTPWKTTRTCCATTWPIMRGGSRPPGFSATHSGRFVKPLTESFAALRARCRLPTWTVTCAQVRNDLQVLGCAATLDKYDSYTVKVKFIQIFAMHEWHSVISQKIKKIKKCVITYVWRHTGISGEGGQPEPWSLEDDWGHPERKQPLLHITDRDAVHTVRHQWQDRVRQFNTNLYFEIFVFLLRFQGQSLLQ